MIAILLAAGYATRLYPLTKDKPKSLLPLGSRLIIDHIMDSVDSIPGITKVALVTNSKFYQQFSDWASSQDREGKAPIVVLDDGTTDDTNKRGAIGDIIYTIDTLGIDEDICVLAGDNMMNGYLSDENIHESGIYVDDAGKKWVRSGDMGYLDEDGYLFFSGRKKRIIIIAGYNIYPATIEEQVTKLPYINEVCAVQGYDETGKPLVKLCVSLKDTEADKAEVIAALRAYCESHIEGYACPRKYEVFGLLPRTKI